MAFLVRFEDLDRITSSAIHEAAQLRALAEIGLDYDGEIVRQSERFALYDAAINQLIGQGRTYDCYCTRREIRDASRAPQGDELFEGVYPGTCRNLSHEQRARFGQQGRPSALRLRSDDEPIEIVDDVHGRLCGVVDDVVLRRNDGVAAYNLAVVVDDAAQGVVEVVRGDDLLASTSRQVRLQQLLGLPTPRYRHVPLVRGADGVRLAKRHGAVTLTQLVEAGMTTPGVLTLLAVSLGLATENEIVTSHDLLVRFDIDALPRGPWILPANL